MAPKGRPSRLDKALQERMYFISHIPPSPNTPSHNILVTGQSGNLYTVTLPTTQDITAQCNCMDQRIRKTLCKHMLFTLLRVLKLPRETLPTTDHNAIPKLTSTLLPAIQSALAGIQCREVEAPDQVRGAVDAIVPGVFGVRERVERRNVEKSDECPICYEEFGEEEVVFCEFGCGNGVHEDCFKRYAKAVNGPAKCVLCRSIWERGSDSEIGGRGLLVGRRLVNVGEVVPHAFGEGDEDVELLGLDKFGKEREKNVSKNAGKTVPTIPKKVNQGIRKGPSDRDIRAKAREERRRLAERKTKGSGSSGRVTRSSSRRSTGV